MDHALQIRNASDCSVSVMPASILTSTARTFADPDGYQVTLHDRA